MKYIKLIFALTLAYAVSSCGAKNPSANNLLFGNCKITQHFVKTQS